jgi:hypothetical protein
VDDGDQHLAVEREPEARDGARGPGEGAPFPPESTSSRVIRPSIAPAASSLPSGEKASEEATPR